MSKKPKKTDDEVVSPKTLDLMNLNHQLESLKIMKN